MQNLLRGVGPVCWSIPAVWPRRSSLGAVELLNNAGTNVMGWYVNGIIPAGALLVGIGSGLGYSLASRVMQVKLAGGFIAMMVVTALLDYWAAQYLT